MIEIVSGAVAEKLVGHDDAIAAIREMFLAMEAGTSLNFPPMRGHGSDPATRFGVKAGFDGARGLPGLKVGSYWPGNPARGLPAHGSTTLLLDDRTGFPIALVEATWLNGLRTAASDAIAVDALARQDARVLAVIGTGNQAYHEMRAVSLVRPPQAVLVVGRSVEKAEELASRLSSDGLAARAASLDEALMLADVIVTATAARGPLFAAGAVRSGTHISAMGADGPGKQELPGELAARARLFADAPEQSIQIGEFQHLADGPGAAGITGIGSVLAGRASGRTSAEEITIYDSSGFGLQDIAIAALALDRARAAGLVEQVAF